MCVFVFVFKFVNIFILMLIISCDSMIYTILVTNTYQKFVSCLPVSIFVYGSALSARNL